MIFINMSIKFFAVFSATSLSDKLQPSHSLLHRTLYFVKNYAITYR